MCAEIYPISARRKLNREPGPSALPSPVPYSCLLTCSATSERISKDLSVFLKKSMPKPIFADKDRRAVAAVLLKEKVAVSRGSTLWYCCTQLCTL
jgi:hypothetical protein